MSTFHKKYNHSLDMSDDLLEVQNKVKSYIRLAKYKTAFSNLTKVQIKYPQSYFIASLLATLNAEDAWILPDKEMNKVFGVAAKKLTILLQYSRGATEGLKNRNYNEYYWFAKLHKKQYDF